MSGVSTLFSAPPAWVGLVREETMGQIKPVDDECSPAPEMPTDQLIAWADRMRERVYARWGNAAICTPQLLEQATSDPSSVNPRILASLYRDNSTGHKADNEDLAKHIVALGVCCDVLKERQAQSAELLLGKPTLVVIPSPQ